MDKKERYPTFCHINDYREQGYKNLKTMMGCSYPLVLWGPSGKLLNKYYREGLCDINISDFLKYVDEGYIKIIAREEWLMDKDYRNKHDWKEGAKWLDRFDDVIKQYCEEDDGKKKNEVKRVVIVEKEDGYHRADDEIEKNPEVINLIYEQIIKKNQAPKGSIQRALKAEKESKKSKDKRIAATREILRDIRNHARAIELSEAHTPFLSKEDGNFITYLEKNYTPSTEYYRPNKLEMNKREGNINETMISLLNNIKEVSTINNFDKYLKHKAHIKCAKWYKEISKKIKDAKPEDISQYVINTLKSEIDHGIQEEDVLYILGISKKIDRTILSTSSLVLSFLGFALDPTGIIGIGSISLYGISIISNMSKKFGYIKPDYDGPRWPFYYCFGESPTKEQIEYILNNLARKVGVK